MKLFATQANLPFVRSFLHEKEDQASGFERSVHFTEDTRGVAEAFERCLAKAHPDLAEQASSQRCVCWICS